MKEWFRPPRHLIVMFVAITLVSTTALAWLSWQLAVQDRAVAAQRAQDRRENAAGLAAGALQKHLTELDGRLTTLAALPQTELTQRAAEYARDLTEDSVLVVLNTAEMQAYPADRLLYYPTLPANPVLTAVDPRAAGLFAKSDVIEFREKDYAHAIAGLAELSRSSNPSIQAEALVRLARNLRKAGRLPEAVSVYEQLARLDSTPVGGIPSDLLARGALCAVLAEQDAGERLRRDASALYADLNRGRWHLLRPMYDTYAEQAVAWLGAEAPQPPAPERLAVAEAVQSLWREWQAARGVKGRQTVWTADRSVLLVARESASRMVAVAVGSKYLRSNWLAELEPLTESHGARIALADAEGHPVSGEVEGPAVPQSLQLGSVTGLPWTLYAISVNRAGGAFTARTRLAIAGVLAIALLVVGGSYLIGRAVTRELAVARLQTDFVTAISHEFRTPLTALRQLSELLAQGRVISEDVRQQYYDVLEHESTRLQRLVEGLLKFGRMEAGATRYQFETVDVAALVRSLVEEFQREAGRHGCTVELDANGVLMPTRADREALGCVIWNLLDNAVKYSPECRTVWVHLAQEADRVTIQVQDRGLGIAREDQQRIFDKFVRGDVAKDLGVQGAGIGLAVARQIVAGHGGEIQLTSEPGAGSTFTVLLPVATS